MAGVTSVIEFAPTNNPGDASPTWVDITAYARLSSTGRGRSIELDRIEQGSATVLLDNTNQRFDPNNSSGPYFGYLKPMRPIRVRALVGATYYPVFQGLVKSWPQEYPGQIDAIVPVECVDGFRALARNNLSASYLSELSGTRVGHVLTSVGWPTGGTWRDIDVGQSTVQASVLSSTSALAHLQDVARSESGLFFMSRDGKATFIDRAAILLSTLDPSLVWSDDPAEILAGTAYPYTDIAFLDSEVTLWNDIAVTANALADQTASDATSITSYFERNLSADTLLTTTVEMQDLANFLLTRYKEPATRISRLVVTGLSNPATLWPVILGREIGDKVRVERNPVGSGDPITQDSVIEGISIEAAPAGDWRVTWTLSPAQTSSGYWIWDTQSTFGDYRFAY